MKTAVFADYKPTDALSASGFMAGLPHGCGLVSNDIYIEMITKLLLEELTRNPIWPRGFAVLEFCYDGL